MPANISIVGVNRIILEGSSSFERSQETPEIALECKLPVTRSKLRVVSSNASKRSSSQAQPTALRA